MTNPVGESVSIEVDSHGIAKMKKTKKAFNYADLFQDFDLQEYRQSYPSNLENRLDGQIGRETY
ncbi:hypothetical protein IV56_GL000145 [Lacticaseibacillus saniviri JCM 17471 = DSM 24301]|uniref:Uncharacterized protein n=2 Tax=Lacticaseibacillus saniviri TaxID=931533 RepID=A0A0R2MUT1_9LACO|nr:hypothetical protein IV56_GL000145 [Lacticaseibacillus saniviri JCM 17471 = DSM 24301]